MLTGALVIDGHTDSMDRRLTRGDVPDLTAADPRYQLDLPRLREGGVTAILSFCGSTDLVRALRLTEAHRAMIDAHPHDFVLVTHAGQVHVAQQTGRVGIVMQLESLSCCMGQVEILGAFWRLGVRVGNLTHGEAAEHGCQQEPSLRGYVPLQERERSRREMAGLTDFGRQAIRHMNALGMVVDLAHANDAAFFQALETSTTPPIFSHGGVHAISPHARCLTDDQLRALAQAGGVHGVAFYAPFIHPQRPSLAGLVDQIEYSISLVGPDHVGLGSDFDGVGDDGVVIPSHPGEMPLVVQEMLSRGWDHETVRKVLGGNFLRVMEAVMVG